MLGEGGIPKQLLLSSSNMTGFLVVSNFIIS